MSQILVVGSLAYDSIQTPSGKVDKTLGGSANYFSLAASLFSKVRVVGVVGSDYNSEDKKMLSDRGVDLAGLEEVKGETFHWAGRYEGDLNEAKTLATHLNVFANFNPQLPEAYKSSEFVFLANIDPDLQTSVLNQIKTPVFVGMDTMNYWIQSKLDSLKKVIGRVNIVLINEGEAKQLTGAGNAVAAAPQICSMGPEAVIIKRGEYGFLLYHKDHGFFGLPAMPTAEVIDPTGAGDSFAGTVFGYLASLKRRPHFLDLKMACVKGTIVSSFTIQDFGMKKLKALDQAQLQERLAQFEKIVSR